MATGAARPVRARAICAAVGGHAAHGWTGSVSELSSTGDGKGVLRVDIGDGVTVGTWDNALSDLLDGTLIEPSSPVFQRAVALRVGQRVRFSGTVCRQRRGLPGGGERDAERLDPAAGVHPGVYRRGTGGVGDPERLPVTLVGRRSKPDNIGKAAANGSQESRFFRFALRLPTGRASAVAV